MNVFTLPSFDRVFKKFSPEDQAGIRQQAAKLPASFGEPHVHGGLSVQRLGPFFEFRVGLKLRVLFRFNQGDAFLVTAGNHDEIRRYVRENS